ncbi:his Kinase A domain protein, partial [Vibrio parahaemolyticus V-223/04]
TKFWRKYANWSS